VTFKLVSGYIQQTNKQTNERTNEQTSRRTSPSRKAPVFAAGA